MILEKLKDLKQIDITDIEGIKLGNAQNIEAATGCTVIICEDGAVAGVDVRGGSPGTRETDLLNPVNMIEKINAVMLSGGSAFGLDASSGAMKFLEERGVGFDVGVTKVPIVCSAVLFDLNIGDYAIRPDKVMGYEACNNAYEGCKFNMGNFGAGTGATVGKILGTDSSHSMKGGLGYYAVQVGDLKIGAVIAVNCLGDVIDPKNEKIVAGALNENQFVNTEKIMIQSYNNKKNLFNGNTTIGVVITNANLTKSQMNKVASMAHNGYGRTMRPAHSIFDGDTIFAMATGNIEADINVVGLLAAEVVEKAVLNGIRKANSAYGYRACKDL